MYTAVERRESGVPMYHGSEEGARALEVMPDGGWRWYVGGAEEAMMVLGR